MVHFLVQSKKVTLQPREFTTGMFSVKYILIDSQSFAKIGIALSK